MLYLSKKIFFTFCISGIKVRDLRRADIKGPNLKRLDKGPEQDTDGVALPQELDESSSSKQPQEAKVDQLVLLRK